ncbi:MAG: aminotransferase class I/II-fold pyridoxal phosphate-dependent enzyme [Acidobacteria bacterium]|nr:aminotransferase class I/II-fold pyridoxal phosphate-dependent enzyme [Acidobacteriota bacterium]
MRSQSHTSSRPSLSRRQFARLLGAGAACLTALTAQGMEEQLARRMGASVESAKLLPKDPANLILLNSNENAYGPSPAALEALAEAHSVVMRYPDYWADQLQEKLAAFHGFDPAEVVVTCGSTELLKMAAQAFLGPGRRLVLAEPTFEAIVYYGRQTGAEIAKVPVTADHRHDLAAMAEAARARPGLVYVCNPNNPTGTLVAKQALEEFLARVPRESVVLVDEAYFHYADDPAYGSLLDAVHAGSNVVIARTFSKIYALAGLRLGYGVAREELMQQMRVQQVIESWNVAGCAAALASLDDDGWVAQNRERNRSTRAFLSEAMEHRGHACIPSQTNFVCVHVGAPVPPVIEAFRQHGISVGRPFAGLPEHIRVSLGTAEEMEKFVAAFDRVMAAPKPLSAVNSLPAAATPTPLWAPN